MKRREMQERVYVLTRGGRRADAIGELERWTAANPQDREAVLWLARLLRQVGRTSESLARYRQVLSLTEARR
jgi:DNA-binding SARP family transcriptional activator